MAPDNLVLREDLSGPVEPGSRRGGLAGARAGACRSATTGDPEKTARTFPVVGGVALRGARRPRACSRRTGACALLGRDSVTINTGGEKVFAEEVEHALKHHPAVYDAVVVGTPHERWGQQVTALVRLRPGASRQRRAALLDVARAHLAAYKLPKRFVFVDEIVRAPRGKADYRWAKRGLAALGR